MKKLGILLGLLSIGLIGPFAFGAAKSSSPSVQPVPTFVGGTGIEVTKSGNTHTFKVYTGATLKVRGVNVPQGTVGQALDLYEAAANGTNKVTIKSPDSLAGDVVIDASTLGAGGASSLAGLSDWPAAVSATEVGYLDGVTSNIQSQLNGVTAGSYTNSVISTNTTLVNGNNYVWTGGQGRLTLPAAGASKKVTVFWNSTSAATIVPDSQSTVIIKPNMTSTTAGYSVKSTQGSGFKATLISWTSNVWAFFEETGSAIVDGVQEFVASLGWTPSSKNYGNVTVGQSATQSFTLTNSGTGTASGLSVSVTGATFATYSSTCGSTLAPSANCTVGVRYTPDAADADSGTLTASATGLANVTASLSGAGINAGAYVTDSFDRANGGLGANWTTDSTSVGTPSISSNVMVSGTDGQVALATYTGATFNGNQYAQATFGSANGYQGVVCRGNNSGNGYIAAAYNTTDMAIYKSTGGTRSVVGTGFTVAAANKTIKLTCNGSTLELFVDGVSQGTRTDSTYTTGYPGVYQTSGSITYGLNNFVAGDL